MEQNLNCDPWRAICKNSILHFASCNFLQYYQLASLQGAKTRSCILHFAFFCKFAISQKLSANIDFLQFARSFCIFSQFCKKVMISKYPPLAQTVPSTPLQFATSSSAIEGTISMMSQSESKFQLFSAINNIHRLPISPSTSRRRRLAASE